jgi:uncharacterized protein YbjT (DUF2867 family)
MSKAVVLGASGLIGGHLYKFLRQSAHYQSVWQLGRRANPSDSGNFIKINFEKIADQSKEFACDDLFCCLGTTIKKAGNQSQFTKIDYDYVVQACSLARTQGAKRLFLVSSIGADSNSKNFYFKTKGKLEDTVSALGFDQIHIFRPSLLLGEREDWRPLEQLSAPLLKAISIMMVGPLKKFKPVEANVVAHRIFQQAVSGNTSSLKVQVHSIAG